MKEKVTSSKKNAVITLSDEVTELSSIKCTVVPIAAVSMDITVSHFQCERVAHKVQHGLE
jgi:hypothetical protein